MAEISRVNVEVWKMRLGRKYATDLPGLKTLSDAIAADASEVVTITATGMDGGNASGAITGNKLEMLSACEELIRARDTGADGSDTPLRMIYPTFAIGHTH